MGEYYIECSKTIKIYFYSRKCFIQIESNSDIKCMDLFNKAKSILGKSYKISYRVAIVCKSDKVISYYICYR